MAAAYARRYTGSLHLPPFRGSCDALDSFSRNALYAIIVCNVVFVCNQFGREYDVPAGSYTMLNRSEELIKCNRSVVQYQVYWCCYTWLWEVPGVLQFLTFPKYSYSCVSICSICINFEDCTIVTTKCNTRKVPDCDGCSSPSEDVQFCLFWACCPNTINAVSHVFLNPELRYDVLMSVWRGNIKVNYTEEQVEG